MRTLLTEDSALIHEQFKKRLRVFQQGEIAGSFTNRTDATESIRTLKSDFAVVNIKIPASRGVEVLTPTRKVNKNVIFFHLGFFTIRILPRKSHTSLFRLFF